MTMLRPRGTRCFHFSVSFFIVYHYSLHALRGRYLAVLRACVNFPRCSALYSPAIFYSAYSSPQCINIKRRGSYIYFIDCARSEKRGERAR